MSSTQGTLTHFWLAVLTTLDCVIQCLYFVQEFVKYVKSVWLLLLILTLQWMWMSMWQQQTPDRDHQKHVHWLQVLILTLEVYHQCL